MRVFVVADGPEGEAGVVALLEEVAGVELAGSASTERAAEELAAIEADVVVVHVLAGDDAAIALIERVARDRAALPVLALTDGAGSEEALLAGAAGVLPVGAGEATFGAALEAATRGLVVLPREELGRMLTGEPLTDAGEIPVERLTARESEVLQLLARGLTNAEIARQLGISAHTAKFHVGTVLAKLGARSRAEAVARAARLGWILV